MTYILYYALSCKLLYVSRRSSTSEMFVKSNMHNVEARLWTESILLLFD